MAKIFTATVRFVQKMNRQNKAGEYPIYLVISFNGRVEKATGVSCLPKYWDKKNECIKRQCPNAPVLNKMLNDLKTKIIDRKNNYEFNEQPYTPQMLLVSTKDFSGKSLRYIDLMNEMLDSRRLKQSTKYQYLHSYRKICEYLRRDDFIITELTVGTLKDFAKWLENKVTGGTTRGIMTNIAAVYNYAIGKRLVDRNAYPFDEFRYAQKFKSDNRTYCLEESHIIRLKDYWMNMVINKEGRTWTYKENALENLHKRYSKEFGILWFLLCYKLNGSAPVEIAMLKSSDCKRIRIGEDDYWAIDFKRRKTSTDVRVRWKRDLFCIIALEHFMGMTKNCFVYPIIEKVDDDEYKMNRVSQRETEYARKWVREAFQSINKDIINNNVDNNKNEPLVDVNSVVMYTARHSFACHYLRKPNASVSGLSSLLSRSPNTIATYIHQLTDDTVIANEVDGMAI